VLLAVCGWATAARGSDKAQAYAVVAGTVFREPGFVFPGAEVTLTVRTPPVGKKMPKTLRGRSDVRGEFAFQVSAGAAEYNVSVQAKGFVGQEKTATVAGDERVDVYFELQAVK
jgi:hypothetical protein